MCDVRPELGSEGQTGRPAQCDRGVEYPWALDLATVLTWTSAGLFGLALPLPFLTLTPRAGSFVRRHSFRWSAARTSLQ